MYDIETEVKYNKVLEKLNDLLISKKEIHGFFEFSCSTNGYDVVFYLNEIQESGNALQVYSTNDIFSQEIEDKYENGEYDEETAIIKQINVNISRYANKLKTILE